MDWRNQEGPRSVCRTAVEYMSHVKLEEERDSKQREQVRHGKTEDKCEGIKICVVHSRDIK